MEGNGPGLLEMLPHYLPGKTEENHEEPQDGLIPSRDSNRVPPNTNVPLNQPLSLSVKSCNLTELIQTICDKEF
jgi:hypothetical protein